MEVLDLLEAQDNGEISCDDHPRADLAIERAIRAYIASRKRRVPHFARAHFSFKAATRLNRKALGHDLYKVPINVAWAVPLLAFRTSSWVLKKMGEDRLSSYVDRLPTGFETAVQREVNWLIVTELLEIPYQQGERESVKDALFEEILKQPEISILFMEHLSRIYSYARDPKFRPALERNLMEYSRSRTAAVDLAGSIISLSAGAGVFGKMTPGALTAGGNLAAVITQQTAISKFVLGSTLGGVYYGLFPVAPSMGLVIASTGAVMAGLAVLTSISGIITDPIQYKLGIHERRLIKLIECLDSELRGLGDSKLKIRDMYIARVFDLLDLLKKASRTLF
jgi:hypothetical protein